MTGALVELRWKIEQVGNKMPEWLAEAFHEIAPEVEAENVLQLKQGQRADGTILPDYSEVSVRVYGKRPGPMTLEDTGDFHAGISLRVHDDGIEIVGVDMKTEMLALRYGDEILGLSEESIERLKHRYVLELLQNKLRNHLLS